MQVFSLQQRAIGELLIIRDGSGRRCMGYPEFLQALDEGHLSHNIAPLRTLLDDISPENECRWYRLQETLRTLIELRAVCEQMLNLQG